MALLRRNESLRPLKARQSTPASVGVSSSRPQPVGKVSPCQRVCLAGNDVRGVLALLAQRKKLGLSDDEAFERAWMLLVETNPFPATTGRICPHRCEEDCSRQAKDGSVAVGTIERYLGDWALERGLRLPGSVGPGTSARPGSCSEWAPEGQPPESDTRVNGSVKVAIIGAGPAGLSCAYHLVCRGYRPTIFESMPEAGGMLRYGIPRYRLPAKVLDAEIQRILDLGVEVRTNTMIGRDIGLEELRQQFAAVFVAPGAAASRQVEIPGARGSGVLRAVDFLRTVARGKAPELGRNVVVVGGGNSAIDVARVCARLLGKAGTITLLRQENDHVDGELAEAIEEGVRVELRAAIAAVVRGAHDQVERVAVARVEIGPKGGAGFSAVTPIPGQDFEVEADVVILALGQTPDFKGLVQGDDGALEADDTGKTRTDGVWRGGDAVAPSFAAVVIGQGRQVALSIHAELSHELLAMPAVLPSLEPRRIKLECYEARSRIERLVAPVEARLAELDREIELGHGAAEILAEAERCFSCGSCLGCERCWMFCTPGCIKRRPSAAPGRYFDIKLESCDGCSKCAEECPAGFLEMH